MGTRRLTRSRALVAAGAAVVLAVAVIGVSLGLGCEGEETTHAVTSSSTEAGPVGHAVAPAGDAGLRLVVADAPAPFVLDVDGGTIEPVAGLPSGRRRSVIVAPLGRDALILSYPMCGGCSPSADVYFLPGGSTVAARIGTALDAVPADDGQGVWTLSRRARRHCTISLLSLEGRPLRRPRRISCRADLIGELPAGLLFSAVGPLGQDAHTALLDASGRVLRIGRRPFQPVGGNLVLSGADRHTPLVLEDAGTGARHTLHWPSSRGYSLGDVTGDPGGRFAVVEFAKFSPSHKVDLWLLDAADRLWRHLPDMPAPLVPKITDVNWTADGRVVLLSGRTLGVWRPGERRISFDRVEPPRQPGNEFAVS